MTQTPDQPYSERWLADVVDTMHDDLGAISDQLSDIADLLAVIAMAQVDHSGAEGRLTTILQRRKL
jgi:hypothetical protein